MRCWRDPTLHTNALAAVAEDDALEHLAAEEGVEDSEALRTAWLAADQRGDEQGPVERIRSQ